MTEPSSPQTPGLSSLGRVLVEQVLAFISPAADVDRAALTAALEQLLVDSGEPSIVGLVDSLAKTGDAYTYYPRNDLARAINATVGIYTLAEGSTVTGAEHLVEAAGRPAVFLPNHLSYSDANVLEVLLSRVGHEAMSNRLTVVAGPKVYSDPMRRFSSLCFGTIQTPQSTALSTGEAVMSVREVARIALDSLRIAEQRKAEGDALLVFVEGTRSRTGGMQRTLAAIVRYFEDPGTLLYPVGITGTQHFVPVGEEKLHRTVACAAIGRPAAANDLAHACDGNRRLMMDVVGAAVARLLPEGYRGVYSASEPEFDNARHIAREVFGD
jgi:hypothetical protein